MALSKLIEKAATKLQLLVRLEEADDNGWCRCVTCGKVKKWNDGIHGGHFISRRKLHHKLRRKNCHSQCAACNGPLRGNLQSYTLWMEDKYGREYVNWLIDTQNNGPVYKSKKDLEAFIKELDRLIAEEKKRIAT